MNKIFFLCGKSSSGKDTLYKHIKELKPELRPVVLYTTRPIREGEKDGVEYHFVSDSKLLEYEQTGKIIEQRAYNTVHGIWKYATVDDGQINLNSDSYLAIGTIESLAKIRNYYGNAVVVPLYIEVPDAIRLRRALDREDLQDKPKYQELCRRFLADAEDFSEEKLKGAGIQKRFLNADMNKCIEEIIKEIVGVISNG
ncbi:MAG: guanylate kinase [Suipraeoptans sp.]